MRASLVSAGTAGCARRIGHRLSARRELRTCRAASPAHYPAGSAPGYVPAMSYIDGYIVPVKTARKQEYIDGARKMAHRFLEWGALRVIECWGDDVPDGKVTDFKRAVAAEGDETTVFSWVEWPSKDVRDAAMKKMADDPEMMASMQKPDLPFGAKRMIFGGFAPMFDERRAK